MPTVLGRIAVCGAGAMGSGIAQIAAQSGASVVIFDVSEDALAGSRKRVLGDIEKLASRGKITREAAAEIAARLDWSPRLEGLADRDLVIEAIIENAEIKGRLFEQLESIVGDDCIIATNTSSIPVSRLARSLKRPDRFVGMHFFNPATIMKLVEVVSGAATSPQAAASVAATASAWGKVAIPVADVPGFIVNRVARPFYAEAFVAIGEDAAAPAVIDALFRGAGFKMGPLELTDLIGQDVNFAVARSVFDSYFGRTRFFPQIKQAALVDAGWLGRKTGRGVYDYSTEQAPPVESDCKSSRPDAQHWLAVDLFKRPPTQHFVQCGSHAVGFTCGRTAQEESALRKSPVVLFDWSDPTKTGSVGFSISHEEAFPTACKVLDAANRIGFRITDRPGLIVARTIAQLVNAAADAVLEQVADEAGIDAAMRFGANYPIGLFEWADRIGRKMVAEFLDQVAAGTGEAIYKPSQYLKRSG